MRRLRDELTPAGVARLHRRVQLFHDDTQALFIEALLDEGYEELSHGGCFKRVFRRQRGRYVVKVGDPLDTHCNGYTTRRRYVRSRRRHLLYAPLAWGPCFVVQLYVRECRCKRGIRGYVDSYGQNHSHAGGRAKMFDY